MQPSISIITPSYNQGQYLEENILSVSTQGITDVEHIIIDACSKDNTKEVLEKYKSKLAYVISEPDKGQSDAVNKGFAIATGEIIGWLNSDDYYPPDALKKVLLAFSDPSVNIVCGNSLLFDNNGMQKKGAATIGPERGLEFHMHFPDINQPATFFRRTTLAEFMPLNTVLHYIMDREMWIKYLQQYGVDQVKTINDTLVCFRYHAGSKSGSKEAEFDNEYATLLHWFALQHKFTEIADLLAMRYQCVPGYTYSFHKLPDKEITLNMIRYFLLKRGALIFNKEQFDFAKKAYSVFDIKNYKILPEEKNALARIKAIASCANWTHYRIKRKLKSV